MTFIVNDSMTHWLIMTHTQGWMTIQHAGFFSHWKAVQQRSYWDDDSKKAPHSHCHSVVDFVLLCSMVLTTINKLSKMCSHWHNLFYYCVECITWCHYKQCNTLYCLNTPLDDFTRQEKANVLFIYIESNGYTQCFIQHVKTKYSLYLSMHCLFKSLT